MPRETTSGSTAPARVLKTGAGLIDHRQPKVSPERLAAASRLMSAYRFMAFLTGVVLLSGTIALILKDTASLNIGGLNAVLWVGHGWLFVIYVVVTGMLGLRLRWPPARYLLVMLAGTIPTMSFVAEHFVTRATRAAATG